MAQEDQGTSYTDVLIIGAGPSGLMAAYWMATYGINARIIDKRGTKVFNGQADGLRSRTQELFDSMGIEERVLKEAQQAANFSIWTPDGKGLLERAGSLKSAGKTDTQAPYPHCLLNQGRIERFIIDAIKQRSSLEIERGVIAESFAYDEALQDDPQAYPITVQLRTLSDDEANPDQGYGSAAGRNGLFRSNLAPDDQQELIQRSKAKSGRIELVKAKYVIGCDGGHSWTRKQLGIKMEGSTTEHIWGVIDMVPITNFPDIRRVCAVNNEAGTILVIPRENDLVRFYLPVADTTDADGRFDRSRIDIDMLRDVAKNILKPYDFDFKVLDWWTAYQVGQRVATNFRKGRVFLAGDAVHTHSPKVGMGMNTSMQDGFNIGWKVALAAKGLVSPSILDTYELERHPVADKLIDYDRNWSSLFTGAGSGNILADMQEQDDKFTTFAEGHCLDYGASILVDKEHSRTVAANLIPGERFPPAKVIRHVDETTGWTTRILRSDGSFKIVVLAGDVQEAAQMQRLSAFAQRLEEEDSFMHLLLSNGEKAASIIDVFAIHSAPPLSTNFTDFPEILRPFSEERGWDFTKIYADTPIRVDRYCDGKAYETWGLDRARGAVVALRPDQYIGWVGSYEDFKSLEGYFKGIFAVQCGTSEK